MNSLKVPRFVDMEEEGETGGVYPSPWTTEEEKKELEKALLRARKGHALLKEVLGEEYWRSINYLSLVTSSPNMCPLAQATGKLYLDALQIVGIDGSSLQRYTREQDLGFMEGDGVSYHMLTRAWRMILKEETDELG